MSILDVLNSPWAIMQDKYTEICGIYARHLRGEKLNIRAIEAQLGHPLQNINETEVFGSVAVLPIHGVLAKKANLFQKVSGGSSMELISKEFTALMQDDRIQTIILDVDSPGGTVAGTEQLASMIYEARDKKRIVSVANELMASAGYWIGSAASEIYITSNTSVVGSIGVVTEHTDSSKLQEKEGIKTTVIHSGKFKAVGHGNAPLSAGDLKVIQDQLDYTYSIFVNTVAKYRGVDSQTVLTDMADGRTFIGEQAIEAGLVDGVSTLQDLIAKYSDNVFNDSETVDIINTLENELELEGVAMTTINIATLKENNPELLASIKADAVAGVDLEGVRQEAAKAERERIESVLSLPMAGSHKALINKLAFDGVTSKAEAALTLLEEEGKRSAAISSDLQEDAADLLEIAPSVDNSDNVSTASKSDDWDANEHLRAEFNNDKDTYDAYMQANKDGLLKIQGDK